MTNLQKKIYKYFEQNPSLRVLFIFDDSMKRDTLSGAEWKEGYRYVVFDGAWFRAKYDIHFTWKDERVVMLMPAMTMPNFNDKNLEFPLFGEVMANMVYHDEDYMSFMQRYEMSDDEELVMFVKKHVGDLQSDRMLPILGDKFGDRSSFCVDMGMRGLISLFLKQKSLLEWKDIIIMVMMLKDKKEDAFWEKIIKEIDVMHFFSDVVKSIFGVSFNVNNQQRMKPVAESMKYNIITYGLQVVDCDTYSSLKVADDSAMLKMVALIQRVEDSEKFRNEFLLSVRELGADIHERQLIKYYGWNAEYYYYSDSLLRLVIESLTVDKIRDFNLNTVSILRNIKLRISKSSSLHGVYDFLDKSVVFYDKVESRNKHLILDSPKQYLKEYVESYYQVDQLYRNLVELFYEISSQVMPDVVCDVKSDIDKLYAQWANRLNYEWMKCLVDKDFHIDGSVGRQSDFFKNYVGECKSRTAVVVSDALRYEVAFEIKSRLGDLTHTQELDYVLSVLPTETKYAKGVLLPHGRLSVKDCQLYSDGVPVPSALADRQKFIGNFAEDAVCYNYSDVKGNVMANREKFKHDLIYIFHNTIDERGHINDPEEVVKSCREAVEDLANFVRTLHGSYAVTNVLLVSDHGFLFNDIAFESKDKHPVGEESLECKTRYYLTESNESLLDIAKVPLNEFSDIDSDRLFVAVPYGTNRMAAPGGYVFAHGGAALQEMVVPVLKSSYRKVAQKHMVDVVVLEDRLNEVSSVVKFTLVQSQAVSSDLMERPVRCALFDLENNLLSDWIVVTLNSTDEINVSSRKFPLSLRRTKNSDLGMQLRVCDENDVDGKNPLCVKSVENLTFFERDF